MSENEERRPGGEPKATLTSTKNTRRKRSLTWHGRALAEILRVAALLPEFTADDVDRTRVGAPRHPNHWGAEFRHAHQSGFIEPAGFTTSRRAVNHGAVLRIWRRKR